MTKIKGKWASVRVPQGLMERIEEFLRTSRARELGLHNRADVMGYVVREFLKKEELI